MSKWTDIRDNALDALHVDDVTEEVKQGVTQKILDEVIPVQDGTKQDRQGDGGGYGSHSLR